MGIFGMGAGTGMPGQGKKTLSTIIGVVLLIFGIIPLLNNVGGMNIPLPGLPRVVELILMALGGILLLLNGLSRTY